LREYALIIINMFNDKEQKKELEYLMSFLKEKNPSYSEFFNFNIKIFHINNGPVNHSQKRKLNIVVTT